MNWIDKATTECISAVDHVCPPTWHAGPRTVHDSMLYVFYEGTASAELGESDETMPLGAGDLLLVPEGVGQTVRATQASTVRVMVIHLTARLFLSRDLLSHQGLPSIMPVTNEIGVLCRRLCNEFTQRSAGWRQQMQAMTSQVVVALIREHGRDIDATDALPELAALSRLEPLLHWIEEQFQDPALQVGAMARDLGVSEMTLRRLFRRALKTSPIAYVNARRMDHACRALRRSHESVQEIAYTSGFNDIAHFYRCFHRHAGSTPGEYRASA